MARQTDESSHSLEMPRFVGVVGDLDTAMHKVRPMPLHKQHDAIGACT